VSSMRYDLSFYIPEVGILLSHRRGNLKSYVALRVFVGLVTHLLDRVSVPDSEQKDYIYPLMPSFHNKPMAIKAVYYLFTYGEGGESCITRSFIICTLCQV
jgi:hypothetical protein